MTVIELITSIRQHKKASLAILVLALLLGKLHLYLSVCTVSEHLRVKGMIFFVGETI